MEYIVKLYVEGGELDGEELACGPYFLESGAEETASKLSSKGSISIITLFPNAEEILSKLNEEE